MKPPLKRPAAAPSQAEPSKKEPPKKETQILEETQLDEGEEEEEQILEETQHDEGEEEEEETHLDLPVDVKLVAGHDNSMTLVVCLKPSWKGKAQILQVNGAMCRDSKLSPTDICQSVMGKLKEHLRDIHCPVAKSPGLDTLRPQSAGA